MYAHGCPRHTPHGVCLHIKRVPSRDGRWQHGLAASGEALADGFKQATRDTSIDADPLTPASSRTGYPETRSGTSS